MIKIATLQKIFSGLYVTWSIETIKVQSSHGLYLINQLVKADLIKFSYFVFSATQYVDSPVSAPRPCSPIAVENLTRSYSTSPHHRSPHSSPRLQVSPRALYPHNNMVPADGMEAPLNLSKPKMYELEPGERLAGVDHKPSMPTLPAEPPVNYHPPPAHTNHARGSLPSPAENTTSVIKRSPFPQTTTPMPFVNSPYSGMPSLPMTSIAGLGMPSQASPVHKPSSPLTVKVKALNHIIMHTQ